MKEIFNLPALTPRRLPLRHIRETAPVAASRALVPLTGRTITAASWRKHLARIKGAQRSPGRNPYLENEMRASHFEPHALDMYL